MLFLNKQEKQEMGVVGLRCDEVEAMSVDIFVKSLTIRCCVWYGCQENSLVQKKTAFWNFIEEEVSSAWDSVSGFILHFDGNLWAGPDIIPGDPR